MSEKTFFCSVPGCPRTTGMQSEEEHRFNITLCDPAGGSGHYMEFVAALDESWGAARRWVEKNCG